MRISDILKGKVPQLQKKKPDQPADKKPAKPPVSVSLSDLPRKETNLYRDLTWSMENFWLNLEKGKFFEEESLETLSKRVVDAFVENPDIIAEMNSPTPPDNYLPHHSINVCLLSIAIGTKLDYSREKLFSLTTAALLHDVGMIKIPKDIFLKVNPLSPEEIKKVREHPIHGRSMIEKIEGITQDVLHGVHQSHERENGRGYPNGHKDGEIHEFAKIIGLADTYEALTHDRVYRKAMCPYSAIKEIIRKDGQYFQHSLLKTLIEVITFYPQGCYVQLNTDEIGIVKKVFPEFPTRPIVQIILDKNKVKADEVKEVDLSAQPFISIKKILKKETVDKLSGGE